MLAKDVIIDYINKYKVLNNGAYSVVFEKTDNIAIKVGITQDDPWLAFANICLEDSNKHFPVIYDVTYLEDGYIATLEKLDNIPITKEYLVETFIDYANGYLSEKEYFSLIKRENILNGKTLVHAVSVLKEEIVELQDREDIPCYVFDMYYSNIMMRGETLVIIDPFAHYDFEDVDTIDERWLDTILQQKAERIDNS